MSAEVSHVARPRPHPRHGPLRDLESPGGVFAHFTPNWFAGVMGTGIVAVTSSTLPIQFPGLHTFGIIVWLAALVLLVVFLVAFAVHWVRHTAAARSYVVHPVIGHFYGALPMALLVAGAATLEVGQDVIGLRAALDLDWVLWLLGTAIGVTTALVVPYLFFRRSDVEHGDPFAGWLMPVVPPMVSAATGAVLVPYAAPGAPRLALLVACYVMFVVSGAVSAVIITAVVRQILRTGAGEPRTVPTVWIALGPFGQSIAAANLLAAMAPQAVSSAPADVLSAFGLGYGLTAWVLALVWAGAAILLTRRAVRAGMPFSLTWWSFTFPVGTVVSGTSALADHTSAEVFRVAAVVLFALLVGAWATVATRTVRDSVRGRLFLSPAQQAALT